MSPYTARTLAAAALSIALPVAAGAQAPAPAAAAPSADMPSIKVGATLFADYTIQQTPRIADTDGHSVTSNAFTVGRAYLNVTGNLSRMIAFRITPDVAREAGSGSSLSGSQTFRLKYAYAQVNLDRWTSKGTWVRLGMQQTPWVDFMEGLWRYRFQGAIFEDREGFLSSSDTGVSVHASLPRNYGDVHAGLYNGETYARPEVNDQKAVMMRVSLRPLPARAALRGLRLTGFYDRDAYAKNARRRRAIGAIAFEHRRVNASFNVFGGADRPRAAAADVESRGWSAWGTARSTRGWEGLVRYERLRPDRVERSIRTRTILGAAYWLPTQGSAASALLVDLERVRSRGFNPAQPSQRRLAVHMLVNF